MRDENDTKDSGIGQEISPNIRSLIFKNSEFGMAKVKVLGPNSCSDSHGIFDPDI